MKLRVAILGSGIIGCDLLVKVRKSALLECVLFVGKRSNSPGLHFALESGVSISDRGIEALIREPHSYDLVFDATSATAHAEHAIKLLALGKMVVNLTPSPHGDWFIPAIGMESKKLSQHLSMVTCGGQAALPLVWALRQSCVRLRYIEAVSTISAASAGPATRSHIDDYLRVTRAALSNFGGVRDAKAILNINPAVPPIAMSTTVFALAEELDHDRACDAVQSVLEKVRRYSNGYELAVPIQIDNERLMLAVRVDGAGDYLPNYAGNLDIITCAAVYAAEQMLRDRLPAEGYTA